MFEKLRRGQILRQPPDHNPNHRNVNQRLRSFWQRFIVSDQATATHEPTEGARERPTAF